MHGLCDGQIKKEKFLDPDKEIQKDEKKAS